MKNSADQGGCYPQRPEAEMDNTLRDLQNSSYPTHILHILFVFPLTKYNTTLSRGLLGQRFINLQGPALLTSFWRHRFNNFQRAALWRHWFNMAKILSKFGEQQLVMVNYACGFNQSETGKYFEWMITSHLDPTLGQQPIFFSFSKEKHWCNSLWTLPFSDWWRKRQVAGTFTVMTHRHVHPGPLCTHHKTLYPRERSR